MSIPTLSVSSVDIVHPTFPIELMSAHPMFAYVRAAAEVAGLTPEEMGEDLDYESGRLGMLSQAYEEASRHYGLDPNAHELTAPQKLFVTSFIASAIRIGFKDEDIAHAIGIALETVRFNSKVAEMIDDCLEDA